MNKIYRISNVDEVKIIQVIEVKSIVGKGIAGDQIGRASCRERV